MYEESAHPGSPGLLRALFWLIALLVAASVVYAAWTVVAYWDRVGV